jgi:hypothetical protein
MNPETNIVSAPAFDMDNNILYSVNSFPVEYSNNNYYDIYSSNIFNYVNNYISDYVEDIISDNPGNIVAPIVESLYEYTNPDDQEYTEYQTAAAATQEDQETEETDYSTLVCCICDNLLVDRYVTCCDACQREYVKIKSLDNYKY